MRLSGKELWSGHLAGADRSSWPPGQVRMMVPFTSRLHMQRSCPGARSWLAELIQQVMEHTQHFLSFSFDSLHFAMQLRMILNFKSSRLHVLSAGITSVRPNVQGYTVLGIKPTALCVLRKHSAN